MQLFRQNAVDSLDLSTAEMIIAIELRKVVDKLVYNLLYAPDYPDEDHTGLEREEKRILAWLDNAIATTRREDIEGWLIASRVSVEHAFASLRNEDRQIGLKEIELAIQYAKNALAKKPHRIDFFAKANGSIITYDNK